MDSYGNFRPIDMRHAFSTNPTSESKNAKCQNIGQKMESRRGEILAQGAMESKKRLEHRRQKIKARGPTLKTEQIDECMDVYLQILESTNLDRLSNQLSTFRFSKDNLNPSCEETGMFSDADECPDYPNLTMDTIGGENSTNSKNSDESYKSVHAGWTLSTSSSLSRKTDQYLDASVDKENQSKQNSTTAQNFSELNEEDRLDYSADDEVDFDE